MNDGTRWLRVCRTQTGFKDHLPHPYHHDRTRCGQYVNGPIKYQEVRTPDAGPAWDAICFDCWTGHLAAKRHVA